MVNVLFHFFEIEMYTRFTYLYLVSKHPTCASSLASPSSCDVFRFSGRFPIRLSCSLVQFLFLFFSFSVVIGDVARLAIIGSKYGTNFAVVPF